MKMTYEETSNIINMTGALPTTDATGKVRLNDGEYFDFTVSSTLTGNVEINWEIAAEDFSSNTFDGKNIKLYLTTLDSNGKETEVMAPKVFTKDASENAKTGRPSNMMSLATGTMSASTSTKYRLRMWVNEDYNPQLDGGGKKFAVRVNVYGKLSDDTSTGDDDTKVSQMKDDPGIDMNENYQNVVKIVTQNTLTAPSNVTYSEDLSAAGDGSVMAYVDDDNVLTIVGDGKIRVGNTICFGNLANVTSIDLTYLDTSQMTSANSMFSYCSSLIELNWRGVDFSNVTDTTSMFDGCGLNNIDLTFLDLSNVTTMYSMFGGCMAENINLSGLNLSSLEDVGEMFTSSSVVNVDFSNVSVPNLTAIPNFFSGMDNLATVNFSGVDAPLLTSMVDMFYECPNLTDANFSNFNAPKLLDMSTLFYQQSNLTTANFSGFNAPKLEDMHNIFYGCASLTTVDFTDFNPSNVTNAYGLFFGCSKMKIIKVTRGKWSFASGCNTTNMFDGCGVSSVTYV